MLNLLDEKLVFPSFKPDKFYKGINVSEAIRSKYNILEGIACRHSSDASWKKQLRKDNETIDKAISEKNEYFKQKTREYILESGLTYNFKITNSIDDTEAEFQEEYCYPFNVWITATRGMCGDSWSGIIFLEFGNKKYLKFNYSC